MDAENIAALNARFGLADQLEFVAGPGGLAFAEISNAQAAARVALQGGHVVTFQPHGQAAVLWLSDQSIYLPGKAIRGGIPVCWPWFAAHPSDPTKPFHGFARTRPWEVLGTAALDDGATELRLGLSPSDETRALWPHEFALELVIRVGSSLHLALVSRNPGSEAFVVGGALHSYFQVGDLDGTTVEGLDGCRYVDKVAGGSTATQHGSVRIEGEVDRVYLDTTATCVIHDPQLARRISIAKSGSSTTVVWNPGAEKAHDIADMADEAYRSMLCVETANALDDVVSVAPGSEHRLEAVISAER